MKTLKISFILVAALGGSQIVQAQVPGAPPERCTAHHTQFSAPPPDAAPAYAVQDKMKHPRQAPEARQAPAPQPQLDPDMKSYRQAPAPPDLAVHDVNFSHPPNDFYDR